MVGRSSHHVKNTQDFIDQIKGIQLKKDQCMMSYDVKALFTSVPTRKSHHYHQAAVRTRPGTTAKNLIVNREQLKVFWSSASTVPTSAFGGNIMSSWRVLLWGHP